MGEIYFRIDLKLFLNAQFFKLMIIQWNGLKTSRLEDRLVSLTFRYIGHGTKRNVKEPVIVETRLHYKLFKNLLKYTIPTICKIRESEMLRSIIFDE